MPDFDLFISYRRRDADRVLPLVTALQDVGLSVWLDQHAIVEFGPITDEIRRGLSQSKGLLAWYSETYPNSRACQMELTAALIAAQREGDLRRRVLVINPESSDGHIEPVLLRDTRYATAPADAAECRRLAQRISAHVAKLPGPLGGILPSVPPVHYGLALTGGRRFVGRLSDLWRVHSALHASEAAVISGMSAAGLAIISGFGGVGKSLLSEEYALRFGAAYPGGIFWLRAHGPDAANPSTADASEAERVEQFFAAAIALGIDIDGLDAGEVQTRLRAKLFQNGQPFLWIVDDLASGLTAEAVKAWLAPAPLGKTLMTTRSRAYAAIGTSVPLDVLSPTEALDLLCSRRAPTVPLEHTAAQGIAQDLGYHPLALDVAAAALTAQAGLMSFAEFRTNLSDPRSDELELAAELTNVLPSGHETSVAATMLRSVRTLPEEGRDFLRLATLLAVAPIPPSLVVATFRHVDNLSEPDAKRRAVRGLHQVEQASLAERGEEDARTVHALIARTMRFHDKRPERREVIRTAGVAVLTAVLEEVVTAPERTIGVEVEHARALLDAAEPWDLHTARLALRVAEHDHGRRLYVAALSLQERARDARRRLLGDDHPDTLAALNNFGRTLGAQGDLGGARRLQERVLGAFRRALGENHPDTLASMSNLAVTLKAQGDLAAARGLLERVFEVSRLQFGEEHPDTLTSMNNLAGTLSEQGDFGAARVLLERVFELQLQTLGADHRRTLTTMNNLALKMGEQGDLAGARASHERVLEKRRQILGEDHPDVLGSMNNLAEILRADGDLAAARGLHEHVREAWRGLLGEDHPDTLTSTNNLALTLWKQGDFSAARALHERVLGARHRVLGDDHPATLTSMSNLALTLSAQGDLAGAREMQERVLEAQSRVLGDDHPATLTSVNNLARTLSAQQDLAGARRLGESALESFRRVLGEDHPDTLLSMNGLAVILRRQGDLSGARGWYERALEARCRVLGEDHPDTLLSMNELAETLFVQGDFARARALLERVLEADHRLRGEHHPDTLTTMSNLAGTLQAQGDLAGARKLYERVLEARRRVLGDDHPAALISKNKLAATVATQEDCDSGRGLLQRLIDRLRKVVG